MGYIKSPLVGAFLWKLGDGKGRGTLLKALISPLVKPFFTKVI